MKCFLKHSLSFYVLRLIFFGFMLYLLSVGSGCTWPRDGWFKGMEDKLDKIVVNTEKISVDTKATSKASQETSKDTKAIADNTIKDPEKRKTWKEDRDDLEVWLNERYKVPVHTPAPLDKKPTDWLETLIYILLGISGIGGMAKGANFLYKLPPKVK